MRLSSPFLVKQISFLLVVLARCHAIELVNVPCEESVKATSKCGAGGLFNGDGALSGTFVCREPWYAGVLPSIWRSSSSTSVCVATVLGQIIGGANDQCGCCNGECPAACTCVCDPTEDKVLVKKDEVLFGNQFECVSRGKASRYVGDGTNNWSCVSDNACPALPEEQEISKEAPRRVGPGE